MPEQSENTENKSHSVDRRIYIFGGVETVGWLYTRRDTTSFDLLVACYLWFKKSTKSKVSTRNVCETLGSLKLDTILEHKKKVQKNIKINAIFSVAIRMRSAAASPTIRNVCTFYYCFPLLRVRLVWFRVRITTCTVVDMPFAQRVVGPSTLNHCVNNLPNEKLNRKYFLMYRMRMQNPDRIPEI